MVIPEVEQFFIYPNMCAPSVASFGLTRVPGHSQQPTTFLIEIRRVPVLEVNSTRHFAKVRNAVVRANTIEMVNLSSGPMPIKEQPCNSVGIAGPSHKTDLQITAPVQAYELPVTSLENAREGVVLKVFRQIIHRPVILWLRHKLILKPIPLMGVC
jgi:hypothetical protein